MSDSSPMMQQYEAIKSQHQDSLLFFRMGDFYEMFKSDAIEASRILSLTLTQRHGIPMCGIPYHARQNYLQRLLSAGRKIAICEQVSQAGKGKGLVDRKVVQVLSPGTIIDEAFLAGNEQNYLLSLSTPTPNILALAYLDLSTGELGCRLVDASNSRVSLAAEIAARSPKELIIQDSLYLAGGEISLLLQTYPDLVINRCPDWQYDVTAAAAQLCSLFGVVSLQAYGIKDHDPHLHPVSVLLQYAQEATRHSLDHLRSIRILRETDTMILDDACIRNLEIVRNLRDGGKSLSLLWVLDQTQTPMGCRLLRQWLLEPCRSKAAIDQRLDASACLYHDQDRLEELRRHSSRLHDLERLAARISLERSGPKDLKALAQSLSEIQTLARLGSLPALAIDWPVDDLAIASSSRELIEAFLVDEPPYHAADGGFVRVGYHQRLDTLRAMAKDSQSVLADYLENERHEHAMPALKLGQNRIIGYYLELPRNVSEHVPTHFMRKHSTVGSERFTTRRLLELEDSIAHAAEEARKLELELFGQLCVQLSTHCAAYARLAACAARLDVYSSFAYIASIRAYVRPTIHEDRRLIISGGRHPVVEACVESGTYIPNDIDLQPDLAEGSGTILLTGPNMAGKSTYLRQTALIVLMAHAGCFVPAESAQIGLVDRIFCRVGASDNLAGGESTFLVEMHETAAILRNASSSSLIIMDEVGRGTSTRDGLAIAWAVLEHMLQELNCRSLFATHFHELTTVQHPRMANFSLQVYDDGHQVVFQKRLVPGPASNSYGIHVARLAGVPEAVTQRAEAVLAWLQDGPAGAVELRVNESPRDTTPPSPKPRVQDTLFAPAEELDLMVRSFNLNESSPLQALNAIAAWQEYLGVGTKKNRKS